MLDQASYLPPIVVLMVGEVGSLKAAPFKQIVEAVVNILQASITP
jgi:hypothetical protein